MDSSDAATTQQKEWNAALQQFLASTVQSLIAQRFALVFDVARLMSDHFDGSSARPAISPLFNKQALPFAAVLDRCDILFVRFR